jgi:hypothetical protein
LQATGFGWLSCNDFSTPVQKTESANFGRTKVSKTEQALKAWQNFHRFVMEISPENFHNIAPYLNLGSDWGVGLEHLAKKAEGTRTGFQAYIYAAMLRRHGEDVTQGTRWLF